MCSSIQRINRRYAFDLSWLQARTARHGDGTRSECGSGSTLTGRRSFEPWTEGEIRGACSGLVDGLYSQGEIEAVALCLLFKHANSIS